MLPIARRASGSDSVTRPLPNIAFQPAGGAVGAVLVVCSINAWTPAAERGRNPPGGVPPRATVPTTTAVGATAATLAHQVAGIAGEARAGAHRGAPLHGGLRFGGSLLPCRLVFAHTSSRAFARRNSPSARVTRLTLSCGAGRWGCHSRRRQRRPAGCSPARAGFLLPAAAAASRPCSPAFLRVCREVGTQLLGATGAGVGHMLCLCYAEPRRR